jgi:hypothetical protein
MAVKAEPKAIYDRIRTAGYSHAQTCGILGNIEQESSFETDSLGFDGSGSFGLCQWLGLRKEALRKFADAAGKPLSDTMMQVDFMLHELAHNERKAAKWLKECKTSTEAAVCFSRWYERPHKMYSYNDRRIAYAMQFDKKFQ